MDIIKTMFKLVEGGDRVLMLFPDFYSFLGVIQCVKGYGDLFWILWTDAAVERINHFGRRYRFPLSGDAIAIFTQKKCDFLNVIDYLDDKSDISAFLRALDLNDRIVVLFGIDFLDMYGYDVCKAIDTIINCNGNNLFLTTIFTKELVDKLNPFHDIYVEISESKDTYVSYRTYKASMRFSIKGGVAEISNTFILDEEVSKDGGF